ncbi:hypothetical protein H6503_05655 [Candidatus Woesearchaeota archaeon]|nr:hypothetical protein [Candidatus Woesearchaeota archaeon]
MQYYKPDTMDCFGCSLANFFLEIGRDDLATRVSEGYMNHPLVHPEGGMYGGTAPAIIKDLTGWGSLVVWKGANVDKCAEWQDQPALRERIKRTMEEYSHSIISDVTIVPKFFPQIGLFRDGENGHAVLELNNCTIDNGIAIKRGNYRECKGAVYPFVEHARESFTDSFWMRQSELNAKLFLEYAN